MKIKVPVLRWYMLGMSALIISGISEKIFAQGKATISEYKQELKTYGFDDPDPVPILVSNPKIYPYFRYEGYQHEGKMQEWKVVKLENDYIEVYVLPEVGGKVWGAVEKSTGEEFIYRNEVMKFRNISMRGPWTSGGIEFNFGIIGHHPSTATPVDYDTKTYEDGSVSCIVGNIDLPSHTQWRVEVFLAPDKAYFETRVLWYNPTHFTQSYYNWMTGAAVATDDLEFFCPGDAYVGHPGDEHPWPVDAEGRQLSLYKENNFGPSKSYHVVGEYNDFFGGYYHDRHFGFGHWAPYDEMPGQKLWLWALSRSGGIWEDLLTDTDGQYIEFQAGRLFNQFSPGRVATPITQADFEPGRSDLWREIWFPVKDIGGLTEVSPHGVLHVKETGDSLEIGINALEKSTGNLVVSSGNDRILEVAVDLMPMEIKKIKIRRPATGYRVQIGEMDLTYSSEKEDQFLDRDFSARENDDSLSHSASGLFLQATEEMEFRNYDQAEKLYQQCLDKDPGHIQAMNGLADIKLRRNDPDGALMIVRRALKMDTYHPEANFVAGKIYSAMDDRINALECFGWAARSLQFRGDANAAMAEIFFKDNDLENASRHARHALDYNRFHIGARQILAAAARLTGKNVAAVHQISAIRAIDPLNHFAKMEQYLISRSEGDKQAFLNSHRSELAYQTYLELAIIYEKLGRTEEAIAVLELAPRHPLIDLWWSYLKKDAGAYLPQVDELPAEFVFPYRMETLKVLEWAAENNDHWKIKYYLALNHWGLGHKSRALSLLDEFREKIHFAPLYQARAALREELGGEVLPDLEHALQIDKSNWRTWDDLLSYYDRHQMTEKYLTAAKEAYDRMPANYVIEMQYANALIQNKNFLAAAELLEGVQVLPFEGASQGHRLWEQSNLAAGLKFIEQGEYLKSLDHLNDAQKWPENLGVGKPYRPDNRLSDFLLAYVYKKQGKLELARKHEEAVQEYLGDGQPGTDLNDLLNLKLAKDHQRQLELSGTNSSGRRGAIADYLKAYMDKDENTMRTLEREHPGLFSDLNFEIIRKALELP